MAEVNPDVPDKPVEVSRSPASDQAATLTRDVLLIVATLPALVGVLGTGDVNKIVAYLESSAFAPALGVIVSAGVLGWRQWLARHKHADLVKVTNAAPNDVGVVK